MITADSNIETTTTASAPVAAKASRKKTTPKAQKSKKKAARKRATKAPKKAVKTERSTPRADSKGATILSLIARPKGATLADIMKATSWQAHSVRGFLSTANKKHGLKIESSKNEGGERVYKSSK